MTEQETYQPKVGDRVRVTLEGVVAATPSTTSFRVFTRPDSLVSSWMQIRHNEENVIIEKLPDSEPEWVDGDVIHIHPFVNGHRIGGKWLHADGAVHWWSRGGEDAVSKAWNSGTLEILYKADGEAQAA